MYQAKNTAILMFIVIEIGNGRFLRNLAKLEKLFNQKVN